ncbi:MAG: AMP-binding protein, partial [Acidobacteria bacterium]|nr:AMP-binding protein [Acidobacteriota bacterium]
PFFQVFFLLQPAYKQPLRLPGLAAALEQGHPPVARFDLALELVDRGSTFEGELLYDSDLFAAEAMEALVREWIGLVAALVANPDAPIASLAPDPGSAPAPVGPPPSRPLAHEAFESRAALAPQAPAVTFRGQTLSYGELERLANRLARHLQGQGVAADTLVGVALERSPDLIVALLAVLKAGGAYVPLDPGLPARRLETMLETADCSLLLTHSSLELFRGGGDSPFAGRRVDLDRIEDELARLSEEGLDTSDLPLDRRAYVIFTSGSTGRPKGVEIHHRAFANFLHSMLQEPGLGEGDVLAAVTTVSFDIAGLEIFGTLAAGARVVLVERETAADGSLLLELLKAEGVTVLQATPATWRLLLAAGWKEPLPLRMLCGGESLPPELARDLLGRGRELWNLYGPT